MLVVNLGLNNIMYIPLPLTQAAAHSLPHFFNLINLVTQ